jgi:hypothetical protein
MSGKWPTSFTLHYITSIAFPVAKATFGAFFRGAVTIFVEV